MKYRPEIDGLRAVAVLPVIFFHAGLSFFSGGYVGVDVFFVISGYLITTIILSEKENGKFTIANFYERRARRILPALTVVLLACLPFAWYWMLPKQLEEFSQSLIAVSLFFSNIFFWQRSGYFDTAAVFRPLLHTWSLAVEEQYYLFFPLFILLTWRFGRRIMLSMLAILGIVSILLAQWGAVNYPEAAFYLIPTRLWEILIGSFVAFYLFDKRKAKSDSSALFPYMNQVLSLLGLSLILYAILAFDEQTPFPSFFTLVPVLGTALIILFASGKTFTEIILSNKFFVGIGLISYSAYLWHQPIFAFARLMSTKEPSNPFMFGLGIAALALAYLTWEYIEKPFRDKFRFNRKKIFLFAAMVSAIIISIGTTGKLNKGFENRVTSNGVRYEELAQRMQPNYGLNEACDYQTFSTLKQCRTDDHPEVLVWGDSFAMHLLPGILASKPDVKVIQMTSSHCGPILGIAPINSNYPMKLSEECIRFNNSVIEWLISNPSVHYAVLSSPFSSYLSTEYDILKLGKVMPANKEIALESFEATLTMLSKMGIRPVVFAPPPVNGSDIGNCLITAAVYRQVDECRIDLDLYKERKKDVLFFLDQVEKKYRVIRVSDVLCKDTFCNTELEGIFIYRDTGHLSIEGSAYLGKKMNFYKLITSK